MGTDASTSDEWLELVSDTDQPIGGWTISSLRDDGEAVLLRFAEDASLHAGIPIIIARWDAARSRLERDPAIIAADLSLPNTKLLLRLRDASGVIQDEVDDGVGVPFAGRNSSGPDGRASMERVSFERSGNDKTAWTTASTSMGFDAGSPLFGTPGFTQLVPAPVAAVENIRHLRAFSFGRTIVALWDKPQNDAASSRRISVTPATGSGTWSLSAANTGFVLPGVTAKPGARVFVDSYAPDGRMAHAEAAIIIDPPLRISEALLVSGGSGSWIELVNQSVSVIDVSDFTVSIGEEEFPLQPLEHQTGAFLASGEYLAFDVPVQRTDDVSVVIMLSVAGIHVDSMTYLPPPPGISIGIDPFDNADYAPLCAPSPSEANTGSILIGHIEVQSGAPPIRVGSVLDVKFLVEAGSFAEGSCSWHFGSGSMANTCDPPPITLNQTGALFVHVEAENYCGNTVTQIVNIDVLPAVSMVSSSSAISSSMPAAQTPMTGNGGGASISSSSPAVAGQADVRIAGVMPNPAGTDTKVEWIEFLSATSADVVLDGWHLTAGAKSAALNGITLQPGIAKRITADALGLSLTNTKAAIELKDPAGNIVSLVHWINAVENRVYMPQLFPDTYRASAYVDRVIDGDTIVVTMKTNGALEEGKKYTIRFLGIDSPELGSAGMQGTYALKAKEITSVLTENKIIELQFDTEQTDIYGRLLAYIAVDGPVTVQKRLLDEGLATVYLKSDFSRKTEYLGYERLAKIAQKGIWATGTPPIGASSSSVASSQSSQQNSSSSELEKEYESGALVISELYSVPLSKKSIQKLEEGLPSGLDEFLKYEWIEIFNASDEPIDLQRWTIREQISKRSMTLPDTALVQPGESRMISMSNIPLRNDGGMLLLLAPGGRQIDVVEYPKLKEGTAYALISLASDTAIAGYCTTGHPTPGSENSCSQQEPQAIASSANGLAASKKTAKAATPKKPAVKKAKAKTPVKATQVYPVAQGSFGGGTVVFDDEQNMPVTDAKAAGIGAFFGAMLSPLLTAAGLRVRKFLRDMV